MPKLDDRGVVQISSLAVGLGLFLLAIFVLLLSARSMVPDPSANPGDPDGYVRATMVLEALTAPGSVAGTDPGGWNDDGEWTQAVNPRLTRIGLGNPVDADRLMGLYAATRSASAAPRLDYEELRAVLGLNPAVLTDTARVADLDVHIRSQPRLPSLTVNPTPDLDLRVWYVDGGPYSAEEQAALDAILATPSVVTAAVATPLCPTPGTTLVDVVVVGSGASLPLGHGIADWVKDCAGTLVVLGGNACGCLPTGANDPAGAPARYLDPSQPLLVLPNGLGATRYAIAGTPYSLPEPTAYTPVARVSGTPVLWQSVPGAYGQGLVQLVQALPTRPYDGSTVDTEEATRLFHNLLVQHYHALFMDYGPTVPETTPARPATTAATVDFSASTWTGPDTTALVDFSVWVFPRT